jgi:hypothetical protein
MRELNAERLSRDGFPTRDRYRHAISSGARHVTGARGCRRRFARQPARANGTGRTGPGYYLIAKGRAQFGTGFRP